MPVKKTLHNQDCFSMLIHRFNQKKKKQKKKKHTYIDISKILNLDV